MVSLSGSYQHYKNENLIPYLVAVGIPEEQAIQGETIRPVLHIIVDGNKVTFQSNTHHSYSSTLILGEEVDETMPNKTVWKSTAKIVGDSLIVNSISPTGLHASREYKLSGNELVQTLTADTKDKPVAKRYYKKL